ncbi:YfjI family protein [Citrobacter braakii]|uniref:YfjI family protein n=1 Tax=Citrobacter braakii TaxID=57706 RepID=UPI0025404C14|nr:YfjI family protein [Citrobacter braakii]WIF77088.1 YfjI family protein [Citrobacter braakii]
MMLTTGSTHTQNTGFKVINFERLINLAGNPADLTTYDTNPRDAKAHCAWFLPSDIGTSKKKADCEAHNRYTALVVDIDNGNWQLSDITGNLSLLGVNSYVVYSTMSAKPDDARWRIAAPLMGAIDLEHWKALQKALAAAFNGDDCAVRSQQISYMPALSAWNREAYQHHIQTGDCVDVINSPLAQQAMQVCKLTEPLPVVRQASLSGSESVIGAFNQAHRWDALLAQYGYKYDRGAKKWTHPGTTSGVAGVLITDEGRYVSSHGCDPLNDGHSHDQFDVFTHHEHSGDFKAALAAIKTTQTGKAVRTVDAAPWSEPKPLLSKMDSVMSFNAELLPASLRDYVMDYAHRMDNAAPDFAAISVMICAGALIGGSAEMQPKKNDTGWRVVPTMWGGAVGQPSSKKTPSLACGRRLLDAAQKVIDRLNAEKLEEYEVNCIVADAHSDAMKKEIELAAKAGDISKVKELRRQVLNKPTPPKMRKVMLNDSTSEALAIRLQSNPLGVLVFRDELSGWLAQIDQPTRQHERGFYLEAFNGFGRYTQERVTRENIELERVIASIIGGIQPDKILPLLLARASGGANDGLLERLMQIMVFPDFNDSTYVDAKPDLHAEIAAKSTFEGLALLGERENPLVCRFDDDAQLIWEAWATQMIEREKAATPDWQSIIGKYPALLAKLALVIHLLNEAAESRCGEDVEPNELVDSDTLRQAMKWMEYLESHAKRITTFFKSETVLAPAKTLLERLPQLDSPFAARDIQRKGWTGLTDKDVLSDAIARLVDAGYLREVIEKGSGRPSKKLIPHPDYR